MFRSLKPLGIVIAGTILFVSLWLYKEYLPPGNEIVPTHSVETTKDNLTRLVYTRHAKCRMDCRKVSENEVMEIVSNGKINYTKSDSKDKPCPTKAFEGRSSDGQLLRIVIADCEKNKKVVTVIDLETEYTCNCN